MIIGNKSGYIGHDMRRHLFKRGSDVHNILFVVSSNMIGVQLNDAFYTANRSIGGREQYIYSIFRYASRGELPNPVVYLAEMCTYSAQCVWCTSIVERPSNKLCRPSNKRDNEPQ